MPLIVNNHWPARTLDRRVGPQSRWGLRYRNRLLASPRRMARQVPFIAWGVRTGLALASSSVVLALLTAVAWAGGVCSALTGLQLVALLFALAAIGCLLHIVAEFFRDFVTTDAASAAEIAGLFIGTLLFSQLIVEGLL